MDIGTDSDEEIELQLKDIKQLNAVLDADEPSTSDTGSQSSFTSSVSTVKSDVSLQLSKIDQALTLNKLTDEKLRRLEKILTKRLEECHQRLKDVSNTGIVPDRIESFRYFICGKPYFKDRSNCPPPDNRDTILMKNSNMYDFSEVVTISGWTVKDKSQFISEILKMSHELKKNELQSKIAHLRRQKKVNKSKEIDKQITALNNQICNVKDLPLPVVALPLDQDYDWDLLTNKLNRRHSAQEYEALWKLFFHPKINKSSWSRSEHMSLQKIAAEYKFQNWNGIAKKLNTGRTGYQCFVYFRTNVTSPFIGKKWTNEEVEYLRRLVEYYREDHYIPWGKVAAAMENRTKIQVYNKYLRLMEHRKGRFLPEEDAVILNCVHKFGVNFKKMMNFLPGRSIIQIRNRYTILTKMRVSAVWSVKEDRKLIQLMANQDSNVNFSSLCEFFPGKDRIHIRSRYLTLVKWMRRNPNMDISDIPRRGARRLLHGLPTANLHKAVEKLKNRMQCEVEMKKNKRITVDSLENDIDDAIVAIIVNEHIKEEEQQEDDDENNYVYDETINKCENPNATNIKKILLLLNANLNKTNFKDSYYHVKYPSLFNNQDVSIVNVKSYSRKKTVPNNISSDLPDIWGGKFLGPVQYVLPPHYATITGCRVLTSLINSSKNCNNISLQLKRNLLLKKQLHILMERFNLLFTWPMLLSNEAPQQQKTYFSLNKNMEINETIPASFPNIHSFIPRSPKICKKHLKNMKGRNNQIDLDTEGAKNDVTLEENFSQPLGQCKSTIDDL